ncbi:FAD:protein FMN transferase [Rudaea sp.]|uniref:FAD:protein FMN transferase n=1 Tax=Rudaea sp. TaxID=2136325 RepID=UPI002ED59F05
MSAMLQRARPWLGTLVEMRVEASDEACTRVAIEAAFAEVSAVHARMSFHAADSDLSRLHAAQVGTQVEVDARTFEVLRCALDLAARSQGCFDPTIAGRLVAQEFLPSPRSPFLPDARASWRDVELTDDGRVRLHRPLWLDLGGIAKGYAVDRAVDVLLEHGVTQALVNAGGDLRVTGPREEIVHLRGAGDAGIAGAVALRDVALASSAGAATRRYREGRWTGVHFDARAGKTVGLDSSASVIAPSCMIADALTKVVFAASPALARRVLTDYGAQVATHDAQHGWRTQGRVA